MIKNSLKFALLATSIMGSSASTASEAININFEIGNRGHILVPVSVNGTAQKDFVFDTGAGATSVNEPRIADLNVDTTNKTEVQLNRAHSARQTYRAGETTIDLAGALIKDGVQPIMMDLTDVEVAGDTVWGVIGYDFIQGYDVSIDYASKKLSLTPSGQATCGDAVTIPFEQFAGTHVKFDVKLGNTVVKAILDTGSGGTGMNSLAAEALVPGFGEQMAAMRARGSHQAAYSHAGSDIYKGTLQVGAISAGNHVLAENQIVNVVDLPVFDAFQMSDAPAILLGADILQKNKISISYSCGKLAFS